MTKLPIEIGKNVANDTTIVLFYVLIKDVALVYRLMRKNNYSFIYFFVNV